MAASTVGKALSNEMETASKSPILLGLNVDAIGGANDLLKMALEV